MLAWHENHPPTDLTTTLYYQCEGNWDQFGVDLGIEKIELDAFLDYAACFLSNVGNYYVWSSRRFLDDS